MSCEGGYILYRLSDIEAAMPEILRELAELAEEYRTADHLDTTCQEILGAIPCIVDAKTVAWFVHYPEACYHEKGPAFADNVLRLSYGDNVSELADALRGILKQAGVPELFSEETWT